MPRNLLPWLDVPNQDYTTGNLYKPKQAYLDLGPTQGNSAPRPLASSSELEVGIRSARRFIAYLPHSGFNNQRIALENAMMLAYILNCTLIAPPVRLGIPLPYRPSRTLEQHHLLSTRTDPKECSKFLEYTPPECLDHTQFTLMPWNELIDFQPIQEYLGLDILFIRDTATPRGFLYHLGLPEKSITFLNDRELYQYRIYDSQDPYTKLGPNSRYKDGWHVEHLQGVLDSSSAIHFGTLFGSGRLKLQRPDYVAARARISKGMAISHGAIIQVSRAIRSRITEFSHDGHVYLAIHVRVGDRKFKGTAVKNGRSLWWQLITGLGISEEIGRVLEDRFLQRTRKNKQSAAVLVSLPGPRIKPWYNGSQPYYPHKRCSSPHRDLGSPVSYLGVPLFVATDATHPRSHPSLAIFYETFPCTFVLSDFPDEMKPLSAVHRPGDASPLGRFLIPLVDAVVAGHATHVVGTQNRWVSGFELRNWLTSDLA
ncbi:hypothetical protein RSOLAG1IB_02852 [Rhizoctonia solani AG-1 IB]|uniref:Uncharacterized protein n=1 Tax=Thanatephorus cucumeris (strain AG1-IB / isolate 7/3/14) TaxID=1108050 RepID=A0A0B7FPP4_THACB|nr:hypothetical protein RSOLAG1IB_02852 [Rhizoctonia solani AG-1 IB]